MPYLRVQTNQALDETAKKTILSKASALVAEELGKAESYVMTSFEDAQPMTFGGNGDPCAYLELKSIGLPESDTKRISAALCCLMGTELEIPENRIYIEFANAPRAMWGWNGSTF